MFQRMLEKRRGQSCRKKERELLQYGTYDQIYKHLKGHTVKNFFFFKWGEISKSRKLQVWGTGMSRDGVTGQQITGCFTPWSAYFSGWDVKKGLNAGTGGWWVQIQGLRAPE